MNNQEERRPGKGKRGPAGGFWSSLRSLAGAIRDPEVPWTSKAFALASFVYLVVPVDAIPDFIPFFGLIDDAGFILAAVGKLAFDLRRIRKRGRKARGEGVE